MLILYFYAFFLSFSIRAEVNLNTDVIIPLTRLNNQNVLNEVGTNCSIGSGAENKVTIGELYNKCAIDLCGSPEKNKSVWVTDDNFSKDISPAILKKVAGLTPKITQLLQISKNKKKKEFDSMVGLVKSNSFNAKLLNINFQEKLDDYIFGKYIEKIIHPQSDVEHRIEYKLTIPSHVGPEFLKSITKYKENLQLSFLTRPMELVDSSVFTEADKAEMAKINLSKLKNNFANIKEKLDSKTIDYANVEFTHIEQLLSHGTDPFYSGVAISNLLDLDTHLHPSRIERIFPNPVCDIESCKQAYNEFLNSPKLVGDLEKYQSIILSPESSKNSINRCKAFLVTQYMDSSNRKSAEKIYNEAKVAVKNNILPHFSEHSREVLSKYLDSKLKFSEHTPPKEFTLDFDEDFNFENLSNNYFDSSKENKKTEMSPQEIIEKIISISETLDEVDLMDNVAACGNNRPSTAWDAYIPMESAIKLAPPSIKTNLKNFGEGDFVFISDFSCTHEDNGIHNIEHEMGHALSFVFANSKLSTESLEIYKKIRTCASATYPAAPLKAQGFNAQEGDKAYTEEDTADLFSFMANPNDKKIYACAFFEPAKNGNSYTNLHFINERDSHSTPLTRALIESVNKELNFPTSCKELIEKEASNMRFQKCI